MVRTSIKCTLRHLEFDICHQVIPLWTFYSVTLTYIFRVKIRKRYYFGNGESWRKNSQMSFIEIRYLPSNCISECCSPWPWLKISKKNILMFTNFETVRASAEMHDDRTIKEFDFAIECRYCECCSPWPWPKLSMSRMLNVNILEVES